MPAFGPDTPVLVLPTEGRHPPRLTWLLWPAWQYRVVTPLVHEPAVNAFQRALLGLARAGLRDLGQIADLLGLDPQFAELVRDDLRTVKYLDEFGAVTPAGLAALADGFLDPQRVVVTHVYQDPFTGVLWPASIGAPLLVGARWRSRERAELDLGTAGAARPITPLAVPVDGAEPPDPPAGDEIIEAVSRGARTALRGDDGGAWGRRPPGRIAARVSLMTGGQPVYLPVVVAVVGGRPTAASRPGAPRAVTDLDGTDAGPTWRAFSPFSGRSSPFMRRLVATRCERFPPLRRVVEKLLGRPTGAMLAEYDQLGEELHLQYGELLERRFGYALRGHREILELLTLLELNTELAGKPGHRAGELSAAANLGWRIQELILREIVRRHPVSAGTRDPFAEKRKREQKTGKEEPVWQWLMRACQDIGLRSTEYRAMSALERPDAVRNALRAPHTTKTPDLLAALVISAQAGGPEHPVRRLASRRPELLTDLTHASRIRNDGSHEALATVDLDFVRLSRRLAYESVAVFLGVPVPDDG